MVRFLGYHILVNHKNIPFFLNNEYIIIKKNPFFKNRVHLCSWTYFQNAPFFAKLEMVMPTHWSVRVTPPGTDQETYRFVWVQQELSTRNWSQAGSATYVCFAVWACSPVHLPNQNQSLIETRIEVSCVQHCACNIKHYIVQYLTFQLNQIMYFTICY